MIKTKRFFIFLIFSFLFLSCGKFKIFIVGDLKNKEQILESLSPYKIVNTEKKASAILIFDTIWHYEKNKTVGFAKDKIPNNFNLLDTVLLSTEKYAQKIYWNVHDSEIDDKIFHKNLVRIKDISHPYKIKSFNGSYPGDLNYPYEKNKYISLYYKTSKAYKKLNSLIENLPKPIIDENLIWIGGVGDILPIRKTLPVLLEKSGPKNIFNNLLPIMQRQDFLIANLETSITYANEAWPKTYTFKSPPSVLTPLVNSGIDLFTLANNHVYDYKEKGLLDTISNLEKSKTPFLGIGKNLNEALKPFLTTINGQSIAVWAIAQFPQEQSGFNGYKHAAAQENRSGLLWASDYVVDDICQQFSKYPNAIKIISSHAGIEYSDYTTQSQEKLYNKLIDSGANIIFGHHPHVLQRIEYVKTNNNSGLIVYSLGNFVFDGMDGYKKAVESMLLSVGIYKGSIKAIKIYPAELKNYWVNLANDDIITMRVWEMSK